MEIRKPIIINGIGRCGSTIFHEIFSQHPNVAWLSYLNDKYPENPSKNNRLMKYLSYPLIGRYLRKVSPQECYPFWEYYCKGFSRPCRDLMKFDVTNKTKKALYEAMAQNLTRKRPRLLIKLTGWPRIGFLNEIFLDAKYIHIIRDGRGIVNSMINVPWWWGWRGPQNWRWGELSVDLQTLWEKYDKSFIVLAAIEWILIMNAFEEAKKQVLPENYLEIKYEDFCQDLTGTFKQVIEFCELEESAYFQKRVQSYTVKDMNYKWQKDLTEEQHQILNNVLSDHLKKYGYK